MRIAFIIDTLYPYELGGAHKRVWELGRRLAEDHDVHVFGMKYWDGDATIEQDGMRYHGVCAERDLYKNNRRSIVQPLVFSASLLRPLGQKEFDIVDCQKSSYFHFFPAKLRSALYGTALVGTFNEIWGEYWDDYIGRFGFAGKLVERTTISLPDEVITISHKNERDLAAMGRNKETVTVIPDGIGFEEIDAVASAEQSFDVLYAGRLVEHKNVNLLLSAVEQLNEDSSQPITCGVVGKGPEMDALKRQAVNTGIADQIKFLGFLEEIDDVYGYMKSASVFVLPSSREGAGLVTLEANACGTPSITTRHENNAATEVVEDNINGYVSEMSPNALAERIRDTFDRDSWETDCRKYAKQYEWDRMAEKTLDVYQSALR